MCSERFGVCRVGVEEDHAVSWIIVVKVSTASSISIVDYNRVHKLILSSTKDLNFSQLMLFCRRVGRFYLVKGVVSLVRKSGEWSNVHGSCTLIIIQFNPFSILVIKILRISDFFKLNL